MKKLIALALAAIMLLAVMPAAFASEDTVHFTYWAYTNQEFEPGSYAENLVESAVGGIDIEPVFVSYTDKEAVANMVNGGDMPDFAWLDSRDWKTPYMMDNELIRTIPVEWFREYCPDYAALYDENPIMWAVSLDPNDPTQMMGLADYYVQTNSYLWCWYMRYDWMVKSGIDFSDMGIEQVSDHLYAAQCGISKDELVQFLDYVVNQDPDENGVADTQGYLKDYNKLLSGFGMYQGIMDDGEGNAVQYYTHPNCKEFLKWMKDLYSKGLIYKEIFTIEWGQDWDLITNGLAGVHGSAASNWLNEWANTRPPVTLLQQDIDVLILPGLRDDSGATLRYTTATPGDQNWGYFAAGVTDEQVIAILRFIEYACFGNGDDYNRVNIYWGEEGVDFQFNAETGFPERLITPEEIAAKGLGYFVGQIQRGVTWDWNNLVPGSNYALAAKYFVGEDALWLKWNAVNYKQDLYTETNAGSIEGEYSADWSDIRASWWMKFIMGDADIDADWDTYIEDLNDAEYDEYLAELNKLPPLAEMVANIK